MKNRICVAHLIREKNGPEPIRTFLESYKSYSSGIEHDLVFLMKGSWKNSESMKQINALLDSFEHRKIYFKDWGFDIRPYMWTMRKLDYDYFLFFNSFSIILAHDWLLKLYQNLMKPNVGIVGASGAYLSFRAEWENKYKSFKKMSWGKLTSWIFLKKVQHDFPPYPNFHIRTNAFMLSKQTANRLTLYPFILEKKRAHLFESGSKGLTSQIRKMGMKALVVDKFGKAYAEDQWRESSTLFWDDQKNLLISDNQTRAFQYADENKKREIEELFWHEVSK